MFPRIPLTPNGDDRDDIRGMECVCVGPQSLECVVRTVAGLLELSVRNRPPKFDRGPIGPIAATLLRSAAYESPRPRPIDRRPDGPHESRVPNRHHHDSHRHHPCSRRIVLVAATRSRRVYPRADRYRSPVDCAVGTVVSPSGDVSHYTDAGWSKEETEQASESDHLDGRTTTADHRIYDTSVCRCVGRCGGIPPPLTTPTIVLLLIIIGIIGINYNESTGTSTTTSLRVGQYSYHSNNADDDNGGLFRSTRTAGNGSSHYGRKLYSGITINRE